MTALDAIEMDGYKSIRAAKIELGAVNVLSGANEAGKSNLLNLFGLLADLADNRLQLRVGREGGRLRSRFRPGPECSQCRGDPARVAAPDRRRAVHCRFAVGWNASIHLPGDAAMSARGAVADRDR
jgi:predicted ATPase